MAIQSTNTVDASQNEGGKYIAYFSTDGGRVPPRSASPYDVPAIVRSQPIADADQLIRSLRAKWPHICSSIFAPWKIYWFFDEYDFHQQGGRFLYDLVLGRMQKENEALLVDFCQRYSECNKEHFHYVKFMPAEKLFHQDDQNKYGVSFLGRAKEYMCTAFDRAVQAETEKQLEQLEQDRARQQSNSGSSKVPRPTTQTHVNVPLPSHLQTRNNIHQQLIPFQNFVPTPQGFSNPQFPYSPNFIPQPLHAPRAPCIIVPSAGHGNMPFPGFPLYQPIAHELAPTIKDGAFHGNSMLGPIPSQTTTDAQAFQNFLPGYKMVGLNGQINGQQRFGSAQTSPTKTIDETRSPGRPRRGSFQRGRGRGGSYRGNGRHSSNTFENRNFDTSWPTSPVEFRGNHHRKGSRRNTIDRFSSLQNDLPAPLEHYESNETALSEQLEGTIQPRVSESNRKPGPQANSEAQNPPQTPIAKKGFEKDSKMTPPSQRLQHDIVQVPVSQRVAPDYVGEEVNSVTRLFVKNGARFSAEEIRAWFSRFAPVKDVHIFKKPEGQYPTIQVEFESTDDVRKVLNARGEGDRIIGETCKRDWTMDTLASQPVWRSPVKIRRDSRSSKPDGYDDRALQSSASLGMRWRTDELNVRNNIYSPQDVRSSDEIASEAPPIQQKPKQRTWADIASQPKNADLGPKAANTSTAEKVSTNDLEAASTVAKQETNTSGSPNSKTTPTERSASSPPEDSTRQVGQEDNRNRACQVIDPRQSVAEEISAAPVPKEPNEGQIEAPKSDQEETFTLKQAGKKPARKKALRERDRPAVRQVQRPNDASQVHGEASTVNEPDASSHDSTNTQSEPARWAISDFDIPTKLLSERVPPAETLYHRPNVPVSPRPTDDQFQVNETRSGAMVEADYVYMNRHGSISHPDEHADILQYQSHSVDVKEEADQSPEVSHAEVNIVTPNDSPQESVNSVNDQSMPNALEQLLPYSETVVPRSPEEATTPMEGPVTIPNDTRRLVSSTQELRGWHSEYSEVTALLFELQTITSHIEDELRKDSEKIKKALEEAETEVRNVDEKLASSTAKSMKPKLRKKRQRAIESHRQSYDDLVMLLERVRYQHNAQKNQRQPQTYCLAGPNLPKSEEFDSLHQGPRPRPEIIAWSTGASAPKAAEGVFLRDPNAICVEKWSGDWKLLANAKSQQSPGPVERSSRSNKRRNGNLRQELQDEEEESIGQEEAHDAADLGHHGLGITRDGNNTDLTAIGGQYENASSNSSATLGCPQSSKTRSPTASETTTAHQESETMSKADWSNRTSESIVAPETDVEPINKEEQSTDGSQQIQGRPADASTSLALAEKVDVAMAGNEVVKSDERSIKTASENERPMIERPMASPYPPYKFTPPQTMSWANIAAKNADPRTSLSLPSPGGSQKSSEVSPVSRTRTEAPGMTRNRSVDKVREQSRGRKPVGKDDWSVPPGEAVWGKADRRGNEKD